MGSVCATGLIVEMVIKMSFGVLTLATSKDFIKAIGLALSVRVSNPGVPLAVACSQRLAPLMSKYFDHVILEDQSIRGFLHKLYLDRYSPFEQTFFFDADVLIFRPLQEVVLQWSGRPYTAGGDYVRSGRSAFGLDRDRILQKIGREALVRIDGAGHAYFEKSSCSSLFNLARDIARDYYHYAGPIRFADEDVIDIAMTILELEPMEREGFWSRHCTGKTGTIRMDASRGICSLTDADTGRLIRPYMMHFAANEAPLFYFGQLRKLFAKFEANVPGLAAMTARDFYLREIRWPVGRRVKSLQKMMKRSGST
jgi:hypothetical protein